MSQNFSRYLELVRTNSSTDLTSLAAEIYLDTEQSLEFIELTKAEIESALVTIELEQFFGDVTDEMLGHGVGCKSAPVRRIGSDRADRRGRRSSPRSPNSRARGKL